MSKQVSCKRSGRCHRLLALVQRSCIVSGLALLSFFAIAEVDARLGAARGVAEFSAARQSVDRLERITLGNPDLSLWADTRIEAYRESLTVATVSPSLGMRNRPVGLEVPVFEGTDELVLNRGAGRIENSALPGEGGNLGIAGHRDGFFRVLKDIELGDVISFEHLQGQVEYRVSETLIVDPDETWVLENSGVEMVTLVTCYPFYFVGHAPQRFIVRGVLAEEDSSVAGADLQ